MPATPIVPDARFLALFIDNTLAGWAVALAFLGSILAVAIVGAVSLGHDLRAAVPAAKHELHPDRQHTPVLVPPGAAPREPRHALPDAPTEQIPVVDLVGSAAA